MIAFAGRRPLECGNSWREKIRPLSIAIIVLAVLALGRAARAATVTWLGNTSANWADSANWWNNTLPVTSNSLDFGAAGAAGSTLTDNLMTPGTFSVAGITFNSGAAAFIISPSTSANGFTLFGSITNYGTSLETINDPFSLGGTQTFTTTAGGGNIALGGNLSGADGITKTGSGTLFLSGSNSYMGITTVSTTGLGSGGYSVLALRSSAALSPYSNLTLSNSSAGTANILEISSGFSLGLGTAAGQVDMQTGASGDFIGFAAYGGNQSVNLGGSGETLQYKNPYFINGGGDGLAFGSPTANGTLTLVNPINLYQSSGFTRAFMTIRGVGNLPEGNLAGTIDNVVAGSGLGTLNFAGNGGLVFSSLGNSFTETMTIQGGAVYAGANDPASAASTGAFGSSTTVMTLGNSNTLTQNIGLLTYGAGGGVGAAPTITVARNINVTDNGTGAMTLGGFTADYTALSGNISLNKATNFVAATGGLVNFGGAISGSGAVNVGGDVVVEGDATTPGITVSGFGIVVFGGSNTYSGGTTISAGTLVAASTSGSALGSGIVTVNGGVLDLTGSIAASNTVNVSAGGTLTGNGSAAGSVNLANSGTITPVNGTLSLGGSLTLSSTAAMLSFAPSSGSASSQISLAGKLIASASTPIYVNPLPGFGGSVTYNLISYGSKAAGDSFVLASNTAGTSILSGTISSTGYYYYNYNLGLNDTGGVLQLTASLAAPAFQNQWAPATGGTWAQRATGPAPSCRPRATRPSSAAIWPRRTSSTSVA